jgi:hypothetical protein
MSKSQLRTRRDVSVEHGQHATVKMVVRRRLEEVVVKMSVREAESLIAELQRVALEALDRKGRAVEAGRELARQRKFHAAVDKLEFDLDAMRGAR